MRLPRGTVVRICGDGGCIQRTITDYGPVARNGRIVDLDRPDFFRVCGCAVVVGHDEGHGRHLLTPARGRLDASSSAPVP